MTRFTAIVTPTAPPDSDGNVECLITGPKKYVADNAIFLPAKAGGYDIDFVLADKTYSWDVEPFWCQSGHCPKKATGKGKISYQKPTTKGIRVHAAAPKGKAVSHYRLNFRNGYYCDPIIINQ